MRSFYGHDHYQLFWGKRAGLPWETPENWEPYFPIHDVGQRGYAHLVDRRGCRLERAYSGSEQMYQAMRRLRNRNPAGSLPRRASRGSAGHLFSASRFERYLEWFNRFVLRSKDLLNPGGQQHRLGRGQDDRTFPVSESSAPPQGLRICRNIAELIEPKLPG